MSKYNIGEEEYSQIIKRQIWDKYKEKFWESVFKDLR